MPNTFVETFKQDPCGYGLYRTSDGAMYMYFKNTFENSPDCVWISKQNGLGGAFHKYARGNKYDVDVRIYGMLTLEFA